MGEEGSSVLERAAGENPLTPGSRSPSPFPVEPGASESAQPAASRPTTDEARNNTTAGLGAGVITGPETAKWISAPGRREHNALAFLRRRWGYYGIMPRGYWVRLIAKTSEIKRMARRGNAVHQ